LVWGICLLCTIACTDYRGLWAQRFFLGVLEGGISPIFMIVVGGWYRKREQALRMGAWFCCTGYAGVVSPLINYGIGSIKSGGYAGHTWKYMYIFAGVLTLVWSAVIYFFLPPDPIRAKGFSARERYIAVARMRENNSGVRNVHWKGAQVLETLIDPRFWLHFFIALLMMIGNGPYSTFTPIIVAGFGYAPLPALLLTIPAGFVTGCIELGAAYAAYKFPRRRCFIMLCCQVPTVISCLLQWQLPRSNRGGLLYAAYTIASLGGTYAVLLGVVMANSAGYTKRTLNAAGVFIGYCVGNLIGPLIFKPKDAPGYAPAFIIVFVTALATMVLIGAYWALAVWENKKRDAAGVMEGFENAFDDDQTDKTNPQFRYTT
jgi:MFS family permease